MQCIVRSSSFLICSRFCLANFITFSLLWWIWEVMPLSTALKVFNYQEEKSSLTSRINLIIVSRYYHVGRLVKRQVRAINHSIFPHHFPCAFKIYFLAHHLSSYQKMKVINESVPNSPSVKNFSRPSRFLSYYAKWTTCICT